MRKALAVIGLLFAGVASAQESLTISDLQVVHVNGLPAIEGIARNVTEQTIKSAFVKFKLYKGGVIVGNTIAHGSDIGPGERWKFQAPATVAFEEAKISSVDTY